MTRKMRQPLLLIGFALFLISSIQIAAHAQNPKPESAERVTYRVQVQLLVASNSANPKTRTDYPPSLEAVVKELKSLLPFKKHYLVSSYFYHVADQGSVEVHDVTCAQFEEGGGLHPMFFDLGISGIKLNPGNNSVRVARFKFEARQRIALGSTPPLVETVGTGITTDLNLSPGVPTIVGTITNSLSDGVLALVITVTNSGGR